MTSYGLNFATELRTSHNGISISNLTIDLSGLVFTAMLTFTYGIGSSFTASLPPDTPKDDPKPIIYIVNLQKPKYTYPFSAFSDRIALERKNTIEMSEKLIKKNEVFVKFVPKSGYFKQKFDKSSTAQNVEQVQGAPPGFNVRGTTRFGILVGLVGENPMKDWTLEETVR